MVIILLLAFVFIVGPTVFIMETTVTGFGNMIKDFFHMATWMEPFGGIKGRKETNFLKIGQYSIGHGGSFMHRLLDCLSRVSQKDVHLKKLY